MIDFHHLQPKAYKIDVKINPYLLKQQLFQSEKLLFSFTLARHILKEQYLGSQTVQCYVTLARLDSQTV